MLDTALDRYPDIAAIVVTGYGTVKDAVEAIRRGASDFISKPFQYDELRHVLDAALERRELRQENRYLREQLDARYGFEGLVGRSAAMRELCTLLATIAPTNSTILVAGETGTGKELAARAIHQNSLRKQQRFVALNCSAIPETLLEAELFGHVRGAFTGAVGMRQGRFEQAHKGTLFLDEVGTMSAALQAKLLRVLQERSFERVGDSQQIRVDVRVIAATNSDLIRMVKEGTFREDLYLPPQRHPGGAALAARPSRGHPAAGAALPRPARSRPRPAPPWRDVHAGSHAAADGVRLAGQRPPVGERRRTGVHVESRSHTRLASTPCPTNCPRQRRPTPASA